MAFSIRERGGCPFERFMVVVSAVRESVRMVISLVLVWSWRAFAMPVRSPSATDAILPRWVDLEGWISPQVDAPLSVIAPPATLPSAPDPSVYTWVAVGLLTLIVLIHVSLSSTLGCAGCRLTCSLRAAILLGNLEPKERRLGCLVTMLRAAPTVLLNGSEHLYTAKVQGNSDKRANNTQVATAYRWRTPCRRKDWS